MYGEFIINLLHSGRLNRGNNIHLCYVHDKYPKYSVIRIGSLRLSKASFATYYTVVVTTLIAAQKKNRFLTVCRDRWYPPARTEHMPRLANVIKERSSKKKLLLVRIFDQNRIHIDHGLHGIVAMS